MCSKQITVDVPTYTSYVLYAATGVYDYAAVESIRDPSAALSARVVYVCLRDVISTFIH